eukprot:15441125-Alexandrium_andersonii.AAC.1
MASGGGDASMEPEGWPVPWSDLDRLRLTLGDRSEAVGRGGAAPLRGLSSLPYTTQQKEALIQRLQEELAAECHRPPVVVHASRVENEHLAALAREDAARVQAEQDGVAQDARHEIAPFRDGIHATATNENMVVASCSAQVAEIQQEAAIRANADAVKQGLSRELRR